MKGIAIRNWNKETVIDHLNFICSIKKVEFVVKIIKDNNKKKTILLVLLPVHVCSTKILNSVIFDGRINDS